MKKESSPVTIAQTASGDQEQAPKQIRLSDFYQAAEIIQSVANGAAVVLDARGNVLIDEDNCMDWLELSAEDAERFAYYHEDNLKSELEA